MNVVNFTPGQEAELLARTESHFFDFKRAGLGVDKFERALVAFANADGGEILVGIDDDASLPPAERIHGFAQQEDANAYVAAITDGIDPPVIGIEVEFVRLPSDPNQLVLHLVIPKSPAVHFTAGRKCFIRRGAQCLPVRGAEIQRLVFAKGQQSFEDMPCDAVRVRDIEDGEYIHEYLRLVPTAQPISVFLRKQRLIDMEEQNHFRGARVLVAGVLALDDVPQAGLSTKCGVKISRIESSADEYRRDDLAWDPETIEGPVAVQIQRAVGRVTEIMESATFKADGQYKALRYPREAIHEIVTNAILHRDYSIKDDTHVFIFDNRIEVVSPGRLPGHITIENILDERFSRNPKIVRAVNRLPDAPNRDIGEGLNTAFSRMREARLRDPEIVEKDNAVVVVLRHEDIASPEMQIVDYCLKHGDIKNSQARDVTGIGSENEVKRLFQRMMKQDVLEPANPDAARTLRKYRLKDGWRERFQRPD